MAIAAAALARGLDGAFAEDAKLVSRLALLVWASEEVFSGANWFRRLLGVGGGAYSVIALTQSVAGRNYGRAGAGDR